MAAFLLAACGGDGNKAGDPDPSAEADFVVDTFGDLSVCTDKREGAIAYVKDEEKDYICTDGDWAIDTNADTRKKSSSSKDKAKSSSSSCEDCKDGANSSSSLAKSSSSKQSSSSIASMTPCKTETEDNCVYGVLVDNRDGQTYKTVKIGGWWWMAENLNYEVDSSFCYHDSVEYCEKYGRLYPWAAAVGRFEWECGVNTCEIPYKARGVCPEGWHLPDTTDWNTLFTDVGGESTAGTMLKSQSGWDDYNGTSGNGTDSYGFSALPAGSRRGANYKLHPGEFFDAGEDAGFWSTNKNDISSAYPIWLSNSWEAARKPNSGISKSIAYSVRCIKNYLVSERFVARCKTESEDHCEYGELKDDRDGQTYKTVKIGDQWWMAENLNYEVDSSFCYNDSAEYCEKYGRLYKWAAAVGKSEEECGSGKKCGLSGKVRGVCPEGWRLPYSGEWNHLLSEVGGESNAGAILRSQTGWKDRVVVNGVDSYGFSALPAGERNKGGTFYKSDYAKFWSATEDDNRSAWFMYMRSLSASVSRFHDNNKEDAYSVRCLQDDLSSVQSSNSEIACKTETGDKCEYGELKDDRDGQTYKTVKIGDQVWMAENLNYKVDSSFCYNDSAEYCEKYGRLYLWVTAVGKSEEECGPGNYCVFSGMVRGVCPKGWHLPHEEEWKTLSTKVGGEYKAGTKLKSQTGWNDSYDKSGNGTDAYGFSVLPAGDRSKNDLFVNEGDCAFFWSSSGGYKDEADYMSLCNGGENVILGRSGKRNSALSVRCIQD